MPSACRECRDDLEHCHGTVIVHGLSTVECTDDCSAPESAHPFVVDCDAVGCGCSVSIAISKVSARTAS